MMMSQTTTRSRDCAFTLSTAALLLWMLVVKQASAFAWTTAPASVAFRTSSSSLRSATESSSTTTTIVDQEAWKTDLSEVECYGLLQTAEAAARAAGQVILDNLGCSSEMSSNDQEQAEIKTSIKDIVTQYDKQAQQAVESIVSAAYPTHSFLGEEDVDPGAAASEAALEQALSNDDSDFIWICDPIDGTANFASGLSLCAVTMAVVYKGTPVVGVIYDPHADEMFSCMRGQGARVNGQPMRVASSIVNVQDAIINAGCPADANAFEASMRGVMALNSKCRGLRVMACSALTLSWIAAGRLTAHFGYDLSSWDLVAGAMLIEEAGGKITDIDGSDYQVTTRNMLCSNGAGTVHEDILETLRKAGAVSFERS